ncbi:MAG: hypothetical protein AB7T59_04760, partial [Hyphomonadaceae bacterium]
MAQYELVLDLTLDAPAAKLFRCYSFEGNDFLPLISVNGEPANESFSGQMAPTPYLEACPYLIDVLA